MKIFKNKKSSLELSIRTIVVVVLAMTLLSLGLGFIRGMFGDIGGITEDVSEQVRQKILDDLITNDKKVSFPKPEITIDKGGSEMLTIGVRNKNDYEMAYQIEFEPILDPNGDPFSIDSPSWFQYDTSREFELPSAESDVRNIRLSIPKGVTSGSYYLTFKVLDVTYSSYPGETYAEKDLFIVVRG